MCGVFGFVANKDGRLNMNVIKRIAVVTEQRGPHAWGVAWITRDGRLRMYKQTGSIVDSINQLEMVRDAVMLIGHTRFATHGDYNNNLNNHPHPSDGGWIVHNGVIHNYQSIIKHHSLNPTTECDSEIIGLLIEQLDGDLLTRCLETANITGTSRFAMLGIWKPGTLIAIRKGNPLHIGKTRGGTYIASLPDELPSAKPLLDGIATSFNIS